MDKGLLSIDEFCEYLGIGRTKAHEILHHPYCQFRFMVGRRLFANKKKLDAWLEENSSID